MRTNVFLILLCLLTMSLFAQPDVIETVANTPPAQPPSATTEGVNLPPVNTEISPTKSSQEVMLSYGVLIFGVFIVLAQTYIISRRQEPPSQSLKYLSISLIIVGALFLVTAGYGNSQIAPIIGLLGTVAGYLLGRTQSLPTPPGK